MKEQTNGDIVSHNPEAIAEFQNVIKKFLDENPNVKHDELPNGGYAIDLDSMKEQQSKEFFEMTNSHREKWNIK